MQPDTAAASVSVMLFRADLGGIARAVTPMVSNNGVFVSALNATSVTLASGAPVNQVLTGNGTVRTYIDHIEAALVFPGKKFRVRLGDDSFRHDRLAEPHLIGDKHFGAAPPVELAENVIDRFSLKILQAFLSPSDFCVHDGLFSVYSLKIANSFRNSFSSC